MAKKSHNPVVLQPDTNIGMSSAETDDEFLFNCFVNHPAMEAATNLESAKIFLSGRTGTGKTAFLRMIESREKNCTFVDLEDLSLNYVANSDIVQFLNALGIDLDIIFQSLWKHIFCIEFIRLRYGVTDASSSKFTFSGLMSSFGEDKRKKKALDYLRDWEGQFWITMDENIKEVVEKFENSVEAELGAEVKKFKAKAGYANSLGRERKTAIVSRAKKFIDSRLLQDLGKVIELLSQDDGNEKYSGNYFILIDRLDERWVDDSIRFQLIRALIECLRSFRKIRNLRILVSIRSDVLERVIQETSHAGFQREKYDDYFLRIQWTKTQLREVLNKRIGFPFRKKYNAEHVFFENVFDRKIGNVDSFDFMVERSLMRPRDVISFVNLCLEAAEGRSKISQTILRQTEASYSRKRLQALIQEWETAFPSLRIVFGIISRAGRNFNSKFLLSDAFAEDVALEIDDANLGEHDPLVAFIRKAYSRNKNVNLSMMNKITLSQLYRIGAVAIKLDANDRFHYSYKDVPYIPAEQMTDAVRVSVHPMLRSSLNLQ